MEFHCFFGGNYEWFGLRELADVPDVFFIFSRWQARNFSVRGLNRHFAICPSGSSRACVALCSAVGGHSFGSTLDRYSFKRNAPNEPRYI